MSTTGRRSVAIAVVAGALLALAAAEVSAQECERRVCRPGDRLERYQGRWVCARGNVIRRAPPNFPCPAGSVLVGPSCVDRCCKSACPRGGEYKPGGTCERTGFGGVISYYPATCDGEGWDLYPATGWCRRQNCPPRRPIGVPAPPRVGLPDLAIESFRIQSRGQCLPGLPVVTFEVVVANRGTRAFGGTTRSMVRVIDEDGGWGAVAVPLGAVPPGATRAVTVPFPYLTSAARHITTGAPHPFRATVDAWRWVDEVNEGNNASRVLNVGAPSGCPPA